jgi:indole-3-glycerol phosphate synthase / phosphoribosylanthranilate isomerase
VARADGILGEIVEAKKAELARRYDGVALDGLRQKADSTRRSLREVIARPGARFILEIKKASPSLGAIRTGADPAAIARGYAGVADALSVLADGAYFGGSLDDVRAARAEFDGPVLAKDFFIDLRQVSEARLAGADAILVMLSVLDDGEAKAMIAEARRLGMDALVEVHDAAEMRRAIALGAQLIGINNRDLRDLSIDLATTEKLAPLAGDRLLISESGVHSRADVERLGRRVDGFLIGSSLMKSPDPAEAARALIFGRVKLCGLNRDEDFAAGRAAAFAGLMFVETSPRAIDLAHAATLRAPGPKPVAVFRDAPVAQVSAVATELGLAAVQMHGSEDADYIAALRRSLPDGCEVWKAVAPDGAEPAADRLLFDNGAGGTGQSFDWSQVGGRPELSRSLIAGGIGPQNAREAAALGSWGLDVGSAVDERPGLKSPDKIAALFDALRPTSRQENI